MIHLKSSREIALMKKAGGITASILKEVCDAVGPGVSTRSLDELAFDLCKKHNVKPAFKGYQGYPASICISINEQVVHGIPGPRKLAEGDIVGLDFGVISDGYYGDTAITVPVGKISSEVQNLLDVTKRSLHAGIEQAKVGNRLFDISNAVQTCVEAAGFSVVREFVGHGIGRSLHEEPQVPNFGPKGKGLALKAGMVIAIEPMVNMGGAAVKVLEDGWTAVTLDGKWSAHFEHTIAITDSGPEILTVV